MNEWDLHTSGLPAGMHAGAGKSKTKKEGENIESGKQKFQNQTRFKRCRKEIKGKVSMVESLLKPTEIWGLFPKHN